MTGSAATPGVDAKAASTNSSKLVRATRAPGKAAAALLYVLSMSRGSGGYDRHITIFSPEGRLYQVGERARTPPDARPDLRRPPRRRASPSPSSSRATHPSASAEYAFKAVKSSGLTAVAVRGDRCVAFAVQRRVGDKLVDASSVRHVHAVTKRVGVLVVGLPGDARSLVQKARAVAWRAAGGVLGPPAISSSGENAAGPPSAHKPSTHKLAGGRFEPRNRRARAAAANSLPYPLTRGTSR